MHDDVLFTREPNEILTAGNNLGGRHLLFSTVYWSPDVKDMPRFPSITDFNLKSTSGIKEATFENNVCLIKVRNYLAGIFPGRKHLN